MDVKFMYIDDEQNYYFCRLKIVDTAVITIKDSIKVEDIF